MKYCKHCWKLNENPLLKLCRECYYQEQLDNPKQLKFNTIKKTPLKQISKKRKDRLSKYSEKDIFRDKLIKSQDENWILTCDVCNSNFHIENAWVYCLPHILAKSKYPHLRYMINNLWVVCSIACHQEFDKIISWNNKQEIENKILNWETINIKEYE